MQLTEENQFVGIEGQADFFGEFTASGLRVRLFRSHVSAGGRVEAAEIGIARARAGLQQRARSVWGRPGSLDEAEPDAIFVAMSSGTVFGTSGITMGIEKSDSLFDHGAD